MQAIKSFIALMLLATLCFGSSNANCPPNMEFTANAQCDYLCGVPCDFKGVSNICTCVSGFLKDPKSGQCVPEAQCTIASEVPALRSGPSFTFACFT